MIGVTIVLAYVMPGSIIGRATAMFMGLCAVTFLPALAHALYSQRPSRLAAKWSLLVGIITWFGWTAFVHISESKPLGLARLLFGQDALLGMPWQALNPLMIALPLSTLTLVAILLFERYREV